MTVWSFLNSTGTSTSVATAWTNWSQDTSTAASTTVWTRWATTTSATAGSSNVWHYWADECGGDYAACRGPTEEEIEAARVAAEERERQRKEAEERAEKILAENLDEEQRRAYAERKVVPITTAGGRKYLIKRGRAGNVYRLDEGGREVEKFCIHPEEAMPDQDVMLSQLLWLRWMEEEFLKVANATRLAA